VSGSKADLPFTLRGYRTVAARRRNRTGGVRPPTVEAERATQPRRDELTDLMAVSEEVAEILAAQASDDITYYRRQANQIVGFMVNAGWTIQRRT
jgi:hypothetical protein